MLNKTKIVDLQTELQTQFPEEYNKFCDSMNRVICDVSKTIHNSMCREKFEGKWLELAQEQLIENVIEFVPELDYTKTTDEIKAELQKMNAYIPDDLK